MSDYASTSSRPGSPVGELPNIRSSARAFRFNYESGRKGPGSVSETTEGRGGDYFASGNTHADLLNTSETSLAVGALPSEWSSARHGFHGAHTGVF